MGLLRDVGRYLRADCVKNEGCAAADADSIVVWDEVLGEERGAVLHQAGSEGVMNTAAHCDGA